MRSVETVATLSAAASAVALPPAKDPDAIGFIQYTSGSTGDPKGVVLSHANLLANVRSIGAAMDADSSDTFVSWLPLYHDMGLIGAWMGCLYYGARLYVMSPLSFLVRPESWLKAIHRYRATLSGGPNFAYELCVNKIDDATLEGLDLSTLRMVVDGAEPVSAQTLRRFNERFARYGLGPGVVAPCYGLAENCVGLAFPRPGSLPVVDRVNREALTQRGYAEPADPNDPNALEIVYCGAPIPGNEVRIVDEAGRELGERREGRLEFRGPSMTRGYFKNEEKTRELYRNAGWVNSGDRAYMANGDIYITGRVKDIIIIAGRNIYPQEIESALGNLDGMRKGGVAAFGTTDAASGTEKLVVLAETRESDSAAREALLTRAHEMVADITGTAAEKIVLVPPQTVPKTSSGKVRRSTAKEMYESGNLSPKRRAMWLQVARMAASSAGPTLLRAGRSAAETLYALWWWLVVGCGFLAAWFAAMLLPSLKARWAFIRRLARGALRLLGVPLSVSGIERMPQGAAVLVFNHASYADAIVLAAVLPGEPAFVAKGEFTQQMFAGPFLRRLGIHFVERYDVAASRADAESAVDMAKGGRSFVFFPEGTFTRRAGLLGFYFGAFKVAAEAGLPVVPGAIRGTREMLRGEQWFARRTAVSVEIAEPIRPTGSDFASVLALRDKARAAILARVGEPNLGDLEKPPQAA